MNILVLEVMLLLNIIRVAGTCPEGDEYIFSANEVECQRCSDDKLFYYTLHYANETFCIDSESEDEGYCWWDTTVESHCLHSEECLWLDDNVAGGTCYCAETNDCEVCNGQTPTPSILTSFECPEDCKVYYVGCASTYCNCFGECGAAWELGCINPSNPHCHTWYTHRPTDVPTISPTSVKSVYWGCELCCFGESKIHITTSSVAGALNLDENKVKVKSYKQIGSGGRRVTEVDQQWEIVYQIGLEEEDSTEDMITSLEDSDVLNSIAQYISTDLEIELETIETTSLGEDDPTAPSTTSDSSGTMIGGIIGALVALVLAIFVGYKLYIARKMKKFEVDTKRMTSEGLSPVKVDTEDAATLI